VVVTDSALVCTASSGPDGCITLKRVRGGARVAKTRVIGSSAEAEGIY
jgi:hypothetical protein